MLTGVYEQTDGSWLAVVVIQDGIERLYHVTREEAIASVVQGERLLNNTVVLPKDVDVYRVVYQTKPVYMQEID